MNTIAFSTYYAGNYNECDDLMDWALEQCAWCGPGGDPPGDVYDVLRRLFESGRTVAWEVDYHVQDAEEFDRQFALKCLYG